MYGYSSVPHKESVHFTTPLWMIPKGKKVAKPISDTIDKWATFSDEVGLDLIEILSKKTFKCDKSTLAHRADLPVGFGRQRTMLDIAYYKNEKTVTHSPYVGLSTEVSLFIKTITFQNNNK